MANVSNFDMLEFVNIVFPVILKNYKGNYYVKGGRVYDIYFKDKTNSIDWDIVGDDNFVQYIINELNNYIVELGIKLIDRYVGKGENVSGDDMVQLGFEDLFYSQEKDPYFIDIILKENSIKNSDYTKIDGIKYMNLFLFVSDLIITQKDRYKKVIGYHITGYENLIEDFNENYVVTPKIDSRDPPLTISKNILDFMLKKANEYQITGLLIKNNIYDPMINTFNKYSNDNITSEQVSVKFMNLVDEFKDFDPEDLIKNNDEIDFIYDYMTNMLDEIKFIIKELFDPESASVMAIKFNKTRKRYKNVIDISWENLSNKYKKYLMEKCMKKQEVKLFEISETCKAYLDCKTQKMIKNTTNCDEKDNEEKYSNLERIITRTIK